MGLFDLFNKGKKVTPTAPISNIKTETHRVAGVEYHADSFMKYATEDPYYKLDKKSIIAKKLTEQSIWEYTFNFPDISLVEEPTNPQDSNAIQVIAGDALLGYIKKGSCSHVKRLLHDGNITSITLKKFNYGKYKKIIECYEEGHYELDKGTSKGYAELEITYKEL